MSLKTVKSFYNSTEAHLAKGMLENHDIKSVIMHENFTTLMPHFTNMLGDKSIELKVLESDYERAQKLLVNDCIDSVIYCPNCGSDDVRLSLGKRKNLKLFFVFVSLIAMIPFSNIRRTYICNRCK